MNHSPDKKSGQRQSAIEAFTLIELMVAAVITVLVIILLASVVSQVSQISVRADAQISSFQRSRFAFERLTRSLSQATLNPYFDYLDANNKRRSNDSNSTNFVPDHYGRMSDQDFCILPGTNFATNDYTWACFFQAPIGYATNYVAGGGTNATNGTNSITGVDLSPLDNLLNAIGFFVEFNDDANLDTYALNPGAITNSKFNSKSKWRYRLMQLIQPTDQLGVYTNGGSGWITNAMSTAHVTDASGLSRSQRSARPIADNVIALIIQAKKGDGTVISSTAGTYIYDTRDTANPSSPTNLPVTYSQLPPQVQVTMVAIDEPSANRLAIKNGINPPDFGFSTNFQNPANYTNDLKNLETTLQTNAAHINYRIFNTTVRIESAKWSDN